MKPKNQNKHHEEIIDQFSKQAIPFMELPGHQDSIQLLVECSEVKSDDLVLDVACGPGLVACEFAKVARRVTGIDLTAKMIDQAKALQKKLGLANLTWDIGTVSPLPYPSDFFDVVISRYAFHHFLEPKKILKEMIRVCQPGGMILIADVALPADKIEPYNRLEKLRDPSHTHALSYEEWEGLLRDSGLRNLKRSGYRFEMELEKQLAASFPHPDDEKKIREIVRNDIEVNELGIDAHLVGEQVYFSYPIAIHAGEK